MIVKILIGSLLTLIAANAVAGSIYIYESKSGPVLLKVDSANKNVKFDKNVKVTYYKDVGKETINTSQLKYSTNEKDNRSKDTYIKVNENIQRATKVVQQSESTTNNVAKFYKPENWSQSDKKNFEYLKGAEEVKVIQNNDLSEVHNLMSANGYSLLGSSTFSDRNLSNHIFISQAKKLGASYVVIYKQNTSTVTYDVNDDLNNLDYAYQYSAGFYVKDNSHKNPNILGISTSDIPLDKRNKFQRNTGAYINNVTKGSRAYFANVILEDVVIAVNGKEVQVVEDLNGLKESELKTTKNLNLTIIRLINNEPKEIQIPISFN